MKHSRNIGGISSREWQSNSGTPKMNEIRGVPSILYFLNCFRVLKLNLFHK